MRTEASYTAPLRDALRGLRLSKASCDWFGERIYQVPTKVRRSISEKDLERYFQSRLQRLWYEQVYCPGRARPVDTSTRRPWTDGDAEFLEMLSKANHGEGSRDPGWRVLRVDAAGAVLIGRGGLSLSAKLTDLGNGESPPRAGDLVSLRAPSGLRYQSPGYYIAIGNEAGLDDSPVLRVYWNLEPLGAVGVTDALTRALNQERIPFKLKSLIDPLAYRDRCDTAVLYIRREDWPAVRPCLLQAYSSLRTWVKPWTPMFTKRLLAGIAVADDPNSGESFGLHRCGLVAEGLLKACPFGSIDDALEAIGESFRRAGLSLERPYLNPGADDSELSLGDDPGPGERQERIHRTRDVAMPSWLDCAAQIGRRICDEAVWDAGRCAWMSYVNPDEIAGGRPASYSALGPELYQGSAGIGLFLGLLYAETGDESARRATSGAVRHALSRPAAGDGRRALGFFDGKLGIAVAAAITGGLLARDELVAAAEAAAHAALQDAQGVTEPFENDLFSGLAGGLISLLALDSLLHRDWLTSAASAVGESLVAAGSCNGEAVSWRSPESRSSRDLLGFSHGAAGIAHALLELWRRQPRPETAAVVRGAFAYERRWFDPVEANWPDFRVDDRKKTRRARAEARFTTTWCHGAPGIALSRWRAAELFKDEILLTEARTALQTTRSALVDSLDDPFAEFCLCHGLTGNAEVLLSCGGAQTPQEELSSRRLAEGVAERIWKEGVAIRPRFGRSGHDAFDTPGLMLGLSGLGWFFLRLHRMDLPSILACRLVPASEA